ncbi:Cytochrome c oxidase subunit 2 [bacterium HR12]|nr:Cytochrome c oxidase subunit 2 [bacterium HR12]
MDETQTPPKGRPRIGREELWAALLWVALTAAGEAVLWKAPLLPERYANTAHIVDDAFLVLTRLAVPVFAFVLTVLVVSLLRFRSRGEPAEDGEPIRGTPRTIATWLGITGGLAVLLIFYPGVYGILELQRAHSAGVEGETEPLIVEIEAARWAWTVTYPDAGVTTGEELVLPVDRTIRFEITSVDVLHSFWIPAFRAKIDAVPGLTTVTTVRPERTGSYEDDPALRLQCAELCGLAHSTMMLPVRVVEGPAFDAWLLEQGAAGMPTCEPSGTELRIVAENIAFDQTCLAVPADTPFTIELVNNDAGVPHNLSIAEDPEWTRVLYTGETFDGVATRTYEVPGLPAGVYRFRCDVHPIPAMSGTFVVKEVEGS